MSLTISANRPLPYHDDYKELVKLLEFLRESYKAEGTEYTMSDAPDGKIIHKLECEEPNDYKQRCLKTPVRSYVSSVINRYNSAVFKNEPSRTTEADAYQQLYSNADGYGTPLNEVMRKALLAAQIDGVSYLLADSTASDTEILTVAQKLASEAKPYIRIVPAESVINMHIVEGNILEAIVMLQDEEGTVFVRWMDSLNFIDITLNKGKVDHVSEAYPHGYSAIPLTMVEPFPNAQSQPVAYSQRNIVNILSLLTQELNDSVFTKFILSGARIDQSENQPKISWSGKRLVVIEDANAKISQLGAEHGCADSLRKQIEVEEANMYQSAGFGKPNIEPTNLSGLSRLISLEDFFINCRALTRCIEAAENNVMSLIADKEGFDYTPVSYSMKYISDDGGEEILKVRDLLALELPATMKRLIVNDYIERFYNVSDEDKQKLAAELEMMYAQQRI